MDIQKNVTAPSGALESPAAAGALESPAAAGARRSPAPDIIRCLACFSVVSVHFLLNNGFYTAEIKGPEMMLMLVMRCTFMWCVPLFLLLSGYLLCRKKPEPAYYKRIGKIYFVYVAASLAGIFLYRYLYAKLAPVLGYAEIDFSPMTFRTTVLNVLGFTGARYSWYIDMYLGLFLLIPFLNIMYAAIPTKRQKQLLLLCGFLVCSAPALLNGYNFLIDGWFRDPTIRDGMGNLYGFNKIYPSFWTVIYPIFYYLIGCYIREYGVPLSSFQSLMLLLCTISLSILYNYWRSHDRTFVSESWNNWWSPFNVALGVLVFTFFINLKYDRFPRPAAWCFAKLSDLCLGTYLLSSIFDMLFYPYLAMKVPEVQQRVYYYVLIVPAVFICSAVVSYAITLLYRLWSLLRETVKRAALAAYRRVRPVG